MFQDIVRCCRRQVQSQKDPLLPANQDKTHQMLQYCLNQIRLQLLQLLDQDHRWL